MVCFIVSVFLVYALNGWTAFLKLCLEMHQDPETKLHSDLGFSTCIHTITQVMFFSTHVPAFRHLCILLNEKKHRNAIFFLFLLCFSHSSFHFHDINFKHLCCSQIRRHRICSLPSQSKNVSKLIPFTECDIGPYC